MASEPYFKENMTGQEFFQNQIDEADAFEKGFEVRLPSDIEKIKQMCELCQIQEEGFCCPEHCCDVSFNTFTMIDFDFQWDTCRCDHCKIRKQNNRKEKFEQEKQIE